MSDPVAWLSNRLDEVEALAKSAASCGDTWTHNKGGGNPHLITGSRSDAYRNSVVVYDEGAPSEAQADHIATFDPAMVLRLVAATRALLELHERWELEEYAYTGNPIVTVENGVTYRHWPAGSITGQRQVGVRYECWHCMNSDESHMNWPCPTMRAVAAGWGWTDE